MTVSSFSLDALRVPSFLRKLSSLLLAAAVLAVLGGCDSTTSPSAEDGNRAASAAEVQLADTPVNRADLQYDPVSLEPRGTFSIALNDARHDRPVTRIIHEGLPDGEMSLRASFAPLQPSAVTIRCRNELMGTAQTMAELDADELGESSVHPVAKSSDEPDSYHYYENDGTVIVETDYKKSTTPSFDFPGSGEPVQCTHVSFVLEDVSGLAPTGVRFGGDVPAPSVRDLAVQK